MSLQRMSSSITELEEDYTLEKAFETIEKQIENLAINLEKIIEIEHKISSKLDKMSEEEKKRIKIVKETLEKKTLECCNNITEELNNIVVEFDLLKHIEEPEEQEKMRPTINL